MIIFNYRAISGGSLSGGERCHEAEEPLHRDHPPLQVRLTAAAHSRAAMRPRIAAKLGPIVKEAILPLPACDFAYARRRALSNGAPSREKPHRL